MDHCLLRQTRKLRDYVLLFYEHSGSQAVQIGHFNSSIKIGRTANYKACSKITFLFLSKSWGGGEKKTKLKRLGEGGKGRGQSIVCSIWLPNSLSSQQEGKGFSRDKEISGEDQSFPLLREASELKFCENLFVLTSTLSLLQLLLVYLGH